MTEKMISINDKIKVTNCMKAFNPSTQLTLNLPKINARHKTPKTIYSSENLLRL